MHREGLPVLSDSDNNKMTKNTSISPTQAPTVYIIQQAENKSANEQKQEDIDCRSIREMIRSSIQVPEVIPRRKKPSRCEMFDENHKEGRLFVAYVLLITLFMMTFGSIGISIITRTNLLFFSDCWKLAIVLAFLTFLIGAYICWEDNICRPTTTTIRQERLGIVITHIEALATNP